MARAFGSYPKCHWFKSSCRYHGFGRATSRNHFRPVGQVVKTPPFHGGNMGSSPVRVTIWRHSSAGRALASHARGHRFEFCCLHHGKRTHCLVRPFSYGGPTEDLTCFQANESPGNQGFGQKRASPVPDGRRIGVFWMGFLPNLWGFAILHVNGRPDPWGGCVP